MIGTLALSTVAFAAGFVATYTFDRTSPLYGRLAMGGVLGLTLMAFAGFVAALLVGLNGASLGISAAITAIPLVTLRSAERRAAIAADWVAAGRSARAGLRRPTLDLALALAYVAAIAVGTWLVADRTLFPTPDGLSINNVNNLGDLPYHMQITASFAYGDNFPPQNPEFAGVHFSYHYIADFLAAMFVVAGASLLGGMFAVTVLVGLSLVALLHRWAWELTGDRVAARLTPLIVVFSGGLGWLLLFADAREGEAGIAAAFLDSGTRYTIQDGILRFGNAVTAILVPQRGLLLGMALAVVVFTLLWRWLSLDGPTHEQRGEGWRSRLSAALAQRQMIVAGMATGVLPMVHLHTFAVVLGTAFLLGLAFRGWRDGRWVGWATYVVITLAIALPLFAWTATGSGANLATFFAFQPGWDRGAHDPVSFWFANTGLFIPLLIGAYAWRGDRPLLSRKLVLYSLPFMAWFIVPNLFRVAPWIWDNIKVLTYWWLGAAPLVALVLARLWSERVAQGFAAIALSVVVMAAGALDVGRAIVGPSYEMFDRDGMALAETIRTTTDPHAVILTAPTYNSPVSLTGRRLFMGYAGFLWSNGLPFVEREQELRAIYAGGPGADDLIEERGISYIVVGPHERADVAPNEQFLSQFPVAAEFGRYRLYATNRS